MIENFLRRKMDFGRDIVEILDREFIFSYFRFNILNFPSPTPINELACLFVSGASNPEKILPMPLT